MGLIHEFRKTGQATRVLPQTANSWDQRLLSGFQNDAEIAGGPVGCSGTISRKEYDERPLLYSIGATWLVKDDVTNEYIWGGELRKPAVRSDVVELVADGWGKSSDKDAEHFLVLSYNLEGWIPGDGDPLNYPGNDKIDVNVGAARINYRVKRHTPFKKNQAASPAKWQNGVYRWVPGVDIRYVAFDIVKSKADDNYSIELVSAVGPFGALTVEDSWHMGPAGVTSVTKVIPAGKDLVGLRLVRTGETKHARQRRYTLKNVRIGSLSQDDTYTLNDMFLELFTRMGASTGGVAASSVNTAPFESESGTLAQIADENCLLDNWFWRIYPNASTGNKDGQAGPIGQTTYEVYRLEHPVNLIPEEQYNKVRVEYMDTGRVVRRKVVNASTDPFGSGFTIDKIFSLAWEGDPPHETLATQFAQKIADYLATERYSGEATFTYVRPNGGGADVHCTKVRPGDQLEFVNDSNKVSTVSAIKIDEDGMVATAELATGQPVLDKWLARRKQLLNRGRSPDAATAALLDLDSPTAPSGVSVGFTKTIEKDGRADYDMVIDVTHNGEDIDGNGTYITTIIAKVRPTDASDVPILKTDGGGWREVRKRNTEDGENDINEDPFRLIVEKIPHPQKWRWEVKVAVVDILHQRSAFLNDGTTRKPANFGPPTPTGVTLDVDPRRMTLEHADDVDAEDSELPHPGIAYSQFEISTNSGFTAIIHRDKRHKGNQKTFRHKKPGTATYWGRIRHVDAWGNKSAWASTSATRSTPSTPAAPAVSFEKVNKRWRAIVTASTVAFTDDEITSYPLQLVHKATHVAPAAGDKRHNARVEGDATGDDLTHVYRNIPANHWVYVRERARAGDRLSSWSAWTDAGQPATSEDTEGHNVGEITKVGHATNVDNPAGALPLDGANYSATYSTAAYPDLFAKIGYTHGGSGATFGVPDMRRRHPKGVGAGQSVGGDDAVAEADRSDGHGAHNNHKHRHHHPNHKHNHGHNHKHGAGGHGHGHNHGGHGHNHNHGSHPHGHDHGQTHNHAIGQGQTGAQNTSQPGATVQKSGSGTTAAGPSHTHTFAFNFGTKSGGAGSDGGTGMATDSTGATPTTDGTSGIPGTDGTATLLTDDATGSDIAETTNDINIQGPTDDDGIAVTVDEPGSPSGHKHHGFKRLHFVIWY